MTVIYLKPRAMPNTAISDRDALVAVDEALKAEFVRLGREYDTPTVVTVAMRLILDVVIATRQKNRPRDLLWLGDLQRSLNSALTRDL
jgi:hypothetical protein